MERREDEPFDGQFLDNTDDDNDEDEENTGRPTKAYDETWSAMIAIETKEVAVMNFMMIDRE